MKRRRKRLPSVDIPAKANHILNLVMVGLILIVFRCWHLAVIQHDQRLEEAGAPQERVVIEPAKRGTIRDRFNHPLAMNRVRYKAAVLYADIRQIPSIQWVSDHSGKRVKQYARREYITRLSQLLGETLHLNEERVEDLIHGKAALYNHLPFVIKDNLNEQEYYRLHMLQRSWPGIQVQCLPERTYPFGKTAGGILGYMGAISPTEYDAFVQEKKSLEAFVEECEAGGHPDLPEGVDSAAGAWERLQELQRRAYQIHDYVGKMGIEGSFEEDLRGYHGKKRYDSDARGNFLRELPGAEKPLSGKRVVLTLSVELQEYAEKLLAQNETIRKTRIAGFGQEKLETLGIPQPWIRGGAIIAMDPNSGEVITMASYPRYDPSDFIASGIGLKDRQKTENIFRWFETDAHIAKLWDQQSPLVRERFDDSYGYYDEEQWLHWDTYLQHLLPASSPILQQLQMHNTLADATHIQKTMEQLLTLSRQNNAYWILNALYASSTHHAHRRAMPAVASDDLEEVLVKNKQQIAALKQKLDPYFNELHHNYDKVLYLDLCRLAVDGDRFSPSLMDAIGQQSLSEYREVSCTFLQLQQVVKEMTKELFHTLDFHEWRVKHGKAFLKEMRAQERAQKRYAKPYIDLYDAKERELFALFWDTYRWDLILAFLQGKATASASAITPYMKTLTCWHQELMQGAHAQVCWHTTYFKVKAVTDRLPHNLVVPYLKTMRSYHDLNHPLMGIYPHLGWDNGKQVQAHLAKAFYPKYGYGFARSHTYRQATTLGSINKLVVAYTALVQRYRQLEGKAITKELLNPLIVVDQPFKKDNISYLGYTREGKPIPQHYQGGLLIHSMNRHIGETDLPKALGTSSNLYFSLLAGDVITDPEDLINASRAFSFGARTGIELPLEIKGRLPNDLDINRTGLYSTAIGQHSLVVTPLQTATMLSAIANGGHVLQPRLLKLIAGKDPLNDASPIIQKGEPQNLRTLFMPKEVRQILMDGMGRVTERIHTTGMGRLQELFAAHPEAIQACKALKNHLPGKTSTAEAIEHIGIDRKHSTHTYNHVWFAGLHLSEETGEPDLIIVVYLKYGSYGRDAYPLAAQVAQKWQEIQIKETYRQI